MKIFVSLVLLFLSAVADAGEFVISTQGKNLSLFKVALPRVDLLAEGEGLDFRVWVSDADSGEYINGHLTFSLTPSEPSFVITAAILLEHFEVSEGMRVQVSASVADGYRMAEGSRLLCAGCREIQTFMHFDQINGRIENLRTTQHQVNRCRRASGKLPFVNKSSNLQHRSFLQFRNSSNSHNLLRISRDPTFSNIDDIALFRIEANEFLFFPASDLEDEKHPKVIQAMSPSTENHQLYVDTIVGAFNLSCQAWVKSDGTLHPIKEVLADIRGLVSFFPAFDDVDNQPLLNFLELHSHFSINDYESIAVEAYRFNGEQIPGSAQISPTEKAIASGKLLVTLSDLRYGNAAKGISSNLGQDLTGMTRLKIRYRGRCDSNNYSCGPRVQMLMSDKAGGVRDFSWSYRAEKPSGPHLIRFFNRAENQTEVSHLLIHNTERFPMRVVITDGHQSISGSLAIVNLPPGATRLLSSQALEVGSGEIIQGLRPSDRNRQLKLSPLSNGSLRIMNLVRDSTGKWHNLSLPVEIAPKEIR